MIRTGLTIRAVLGIASKGNTSGVFMDLAIRMIMLPTRRHETTRPCFVTRQKQNNPFGTPSNQSFATA
jgi:hypothetical protein